MKTTRYQVRITYIYDNIATDFYSEIASYRLVFQPVQVISGS